MDPSAAGSVSVGTGDNGNTLIKVRVDYLAKPDRIDPADTTYIVWVVPADGDVHPQSMGALRVDKDLHGQLDTVSVLQRFRLFITPEPNAAASAPSGPHVLEAFVDHIK